LDDLIHDEDRSSDFLFNSGELAELRDETSVSLSAEFSENGGPGKFCENSDLGSRRFRNVKLSTRVLSSKSAMS
jgi:hypothetical protein